jgi:hypothetical protein
MPIGGQ